MELSGILQCSNEFTTGPYPTSKQSSPYPQHSTYQYLWYILIISSHLLLGLLKDASLQITNFIEQNPTCGVPSRLDIQEFPRYLWSHKKYYRVQKRPHVFRRTVAVAERTVACTVFTRLEGGIVDSNTTKTWMFGMCMCLF
jgi:hypothetical protein